MREIDEILPVIDNIEDVSEETINELSNGLENGEVLID